MEKREDTAKQLRRLYYKELCVTRNSTVSSTLTIDSVTSKDEGTDSCYATLNKAMVTSRQSVLTDTSYFH